MATFEERETIRKAGEVPETELGQDEVEYEEESEAGGVLGLVNKCVGLSLAGGIEGGSFRIRAAEGSKGEGAAGGSNRPTVGGYGLQGISVLAQGFGLNVTVRMWLHPLSLAAQDVEGGGVSVSGGQGGLEGVGSGGSALAGGLACVDGFAAILTVFSQDAVGCEGGRRIGLGLDGVGVESRVVVKGGIAGSGEGHGEGSGVGMGWMNNDGGGVLDGIGVVGGRVVVGGIARIVGRHGEGGRLDARLVVNDGGGGGGYLGVNSVWKLLVLLLVGG